MPLTSWGEPYAFSENDIFPTTKKPVFNSTTTFPPTILTQDSRCAAKEKDFQSWRDFPRDIYGLSRYYFLKYKKQGQPVTFWSKLIDSAQSFLGTWTASMLSFYIDDKENYIIGYNKVMRKTEFILKIDRITNNSKTVIKLSPAVDLDVCDNCFQIYSKKTLIQHYDHYICKKCCKRIMIPCVKCKKDIFKNSSLNSKTSLLPSFNNGVYASIIVEDAPYCSSCFKEEFAVCSHCSKIVPASQRHLGFVSNNMFICSECKLHYIPCADCGRLLDRTIDHREGQEVYCHSCRANHNVIKKYDYIPKFKLNHVAGDNGLCLGIELEIETNTRPEQYEDCAITFLNFLKKEKIQEYYYIKYDGTVKGFEIVTHPATLRFIHQNYKLQQVLLFCKKAGWTSYKSGNCGLHVHLSRSFFNDYHKKIFRLFFSTNSFFLNKFSKRDGQNVKFCRYEVLSVYQIKDYIENTLSQDDKYFAYRMHPTGKNTIELRIFRGTLDYERFLATLQFCDALAHFVKAIGLSLCTTKKSWLEFIKWSKQTSRYNHFIKYIQNKEKLLEAET